MNTTEYFDMLRKMHQPKAGQSDAEDTSSASEPDSSDTSVKEDERGGFLR